ncbi:MAG: RecX family transcriptional regulator [Novosphingobium sp.]|nr:RecX family transcriptional regulator [Novosphingobium sp.]
MTERRAPLHRPLDGRRLEELALAYAARFATTRGKLTTYLHRKLRERGWAGEGEADVAGIVARFAEAGYVDDAAFARARTGGLLRRGYGARRIADTLMAAGIEPELRRALRPDVVTARSAALALARKRGFGPFGAAPADREQCRKLREKQIAALLRAGHPLDNARQLVDATSVEAAEEWAAEGQGGAA